jgi:hypothetical protein
MRHSEARNCSFLKKRTKKTFARLATWPISTGTAHASWQKFFGSFFQKITLPYIR